MIPESFINELLNRIDVVDIIDKRVPLKKTGANFVACCPFHQEKTPSFSVSPSKQFYHCFGCGAHGSAISFLIDHDGLNFIDAIHELAKVVGLKVPNQVDEKPEKKKENIVLEDSLILAKKWCSIAHPGELCPRSRLGRGLITGASAGAGAGLHLHHCSPAHHGGWRDKPGQKSRRRQALSLSE